MFQEDLRQHGRRAPDIHPHPPFVSDTQTETSTPPSESSTTATSTSLSTPAPTASDSDPAMPQASFLYPTELLTFNNIDVVQVSYQSIWNNVNLQVFCAIDRDSSEFALAKINQIQPNGTYAIAPIQAGMQIPQFPTYCNFMLSDANNVTDYTTGAGFSMVSTQGVATTYAAAITQAATATPASDSSKPSTAEASQTTSTQASLSTNSAAVSSSASTGTAVSSTSQSSSLSGGAKAGIAIGVILGIAALAAIIFFLLRMKRRMDKIEGLVTLRSGASSVNVAQSSEKTAERDAQVASPTPAPAPIPSPSPPPDTCGPRIQVFKIGENHRNSEDWRRFFGNNKTQ